MLKPIFHIIGSHMILTCTIYSSSVSSYDMRNSGGSPITLSRTNFLVAMQEDHDRVSQEYFSTISLIENIRASFPSKNLILQEEVNDLTVKEHHPITRSEHLSPLLFALYHKNYTLALALAQKFPDQMYTVDSQGNTPLHYFCAFSEQLKTNDREFINLCIPLINTRNSLNIPPIMRVKSLKLLVSLLMRGAYVTETLMSQQKPKSWEYLGILATLNIFGFKKTFLGRTFNDRNKSRITFIREFLISGLSRFIQEEASHMIEEGYTSTDISKKAQRFPESIQQIIQAGIKEHSKKFMQKYGEKQIILALQARELYRSPKPYFYR